ncbi:flavin-containing monooxygenase [Polycyclovorans algicola]|uniref:flavin-containing monooxygenase n=1 Tax=Polycyclovorans algicola TaxID=616992 RepID=UPI0004A6C075|nr:NAD(P)/FAD-dependent oxidoreductase [Polycyclovorans algicola]
MGQAQNLPQHVDAVVIGAGIAGLYGLYRLREQGLNVRCFEAGNSVGGTWYWNRYPGARVDSASHVYQYWFSESLAKKWRWSERFPAQAETERYLNFVADECDLRKDIRFGTRIESAHFDAATQRWTVKTDSGETVNTQFILASTGGLSAPLVPPFPGHEKFKGQIFHTGRWPKDGVDFSGKRVGVIGTGATGIQVIQTIASQVEHLTVFQRTANWSIPMRNPKLTDADRKVFDDSFHEMRQKVQRTFAGFEFDFQDGTFAELPPDKRHEAMEALWNDGSLAFWVGSFIDVFFETEVAHEFSKFAEARIRARIKDPKVADLLVPRDHEFGTRRVPLETGYYEAYNRDNVALVDVKGNKITEITETGLKLADGTEYPLDILIMATGFDAGTGSLTRIDIRGRDGISLKQQWGQEIRTMMGLQVHGYPNLFTTMAPFAPAAAFCNVPTCLQQQIDWINECIKYVRDKGGQTIEATAEAEEQWLQHHDEVSKPTLVANTDSWYTCANVEGKPRRMLSYLGGVNAYRETCETVKAKGYEGFEIA